MAAVQQQATTGKTATQAPQLIMAEMDTALAVTAVRARTRMLRPLLSIVAEAERVATAAAVAVQQAARRITMWQPINGMARTVSAVREAMAVQAAWELLFCTIEVGAWQVL